MKPVLVICAILMSISSMGQTADKNTFTISYFGEMITHPGVRIGVDIPIRKWGEKKNNQMIVSPTAGIFTHRRYQNSYFVLPELSYKRLREKGFNPSVGIGFGFMKSQVPDTYVVATDGLVHELRISHWYFLTSFFTSFEKRYERGKKAPITLFVKPQIMLGYPNFPSNVGYFVFEIGIKRDMAN